MAGFVQRDMAGVGGRRRFERQRHGNDPGRSKPANSFPYGNGHDRRPDLHGDAKRAAAPGVNPVTTSPVRPIAADYSAALDRMILVRPTRIC